MVASTMDRRNVLGFFLAGLFNNSSYVIMIAGAKHISPSAVGLVYTANILPSFLVKLTGPYWFHFVPYKTRIYVAAVLMALSFLAVTLGQILDNNLALQLFGIVLGSVQSGFGEASFLALAAFFPSRTALTAWSSGTGFAGLFGYSWVIVFTVFAGASFRIATLCALIFPLAFVLNFTSLITDPHIARDEPRESEMTSTESVCEGGVSVKITEEGASDSDISRSSSSGSESVNGVAMLLRPSETRSSHMSALSPSSSSSSSNPPEDLSAAAGSMNSRERLEATLVLWPYMLPLFVVYFAEYAMQSGVWAAMGFPVDDEDARELFYEYSNWMYQAGVLVSRSSGLLYQASLPQLQVMPVLQLGLLIFFLLDAYYQFWYSYSLLPLCFCVGLLGGAVYVNGFALISEKVPPHLKEFSLSTASIADSVGIAFANVAGIFIQKALYDYHDLSDD